VKKLIAAVIVILIAGVGASRVYDWWNYNINTPISSSSQPVAFHINEGELPSAVAQDLADKGLIRNKDIFEWYLRLTGGGATFQAGSFLLNRNMSIVQIVSALQHAAPNQKVITIPEGFPLKFQADFVEKAWPGMGKAYLQSAAAVRLPVLGPRERQPAAGGLPVPRHVYGGPDPRRRWAHQAAARPVRRRLFGGPARSDRPGDGQPAGGERREHGHPRLDGRA
jgi:hypothetical protein